MADQTKTKTPHSGHEPDDTTGGGDHGHYILPDSVALKTLLALAALTVITVALSYVHLGSMNFVVGMIVATIKGFLVVSIFMGLRHDDKANAIIFGSGFVFLGIFFILTAPDTMFRGDVYVNGKSLTMPVKGVSKFKKAWEPTPELVAHGKELYAVNCVSCHGVVGHGDGPAAGALVPKPRNFTADVGWKNGRKPSGIFKTLKEGIAGSGMASFSTLVGEDRWALSHFVASLGPDVLKDEPADLTAAGVDPTQDGPAAEAPTIPVNRAIEFMANETTKEGAAGNVKLGVDPVDLSGYGRRLDQRTFAPKE